MPGLLTLDDVRLEAAGGHAELSARVAVAGPRPSGEPWPGRLLLRVDQEQADWLDPSPDPFVPVAYVTAAYHGLDLAVPEGVSARLLETLPAIGELYETFWSDGRRVRFRGPRVSAPARPRTRRGQGAAAFFSSTTGRPSGGSRRWAGCPATRRSSRPYASAGRTPTPTTAAAARSASGPWWP